MLFAGPWYVTLRARPCSSLYVWIFIILFLSRCSGAHIRARTCTDNCYTVAPGYNPPRTTAHARCNMMRPMWVTRCAGTSPDAPSVVTLFTDNQCYLFNCGEGVQRTLQSYKVSASRLNTVLLTSTAWRNTGGLPGFLLTKAAATDTRGSLVAPGGKDPTTEVALKPDRSAAKKINICTPVRLPWLLILAYDCKLRACLYIAGMLV